VAQAIEAVACTADETTIGTGQGDVGKRQGMTKAVRIGLPAAIAVAGVMLMVLGEEDSMLGAGIVLVGVALLVVLINVLMRLAIRSEHEAWARRYLDRHGHWPQQGTRP
jgi:hypothetical protein